MTKSHVQVNVIVHQEDACGSSQRLFTLPVPPCSTGITEPAHCTNNEGNTVKLGHTTLLLGKGSPTYGATVTAAMPCA